MESTVCVKLVGSAVITQALGAVNRYFALAGAGADRVADVANGSPAIP